MTKHLNTDDNKSNNMKKTIVSSKAKDSLLKVININDTNNNKKNRVYDCELS